MSKKLTGNGRWEASRMMLPEHREALLERQKPTAPEASVKAQVPTREELEMIRDAVLLPIVLTMIEKNGQEIALSSHTLKKLYMAVTSLLMNRVHAELAKVNKELRERKIKVFKDEQADLDLHYRYICRGYEDKFSIMRDVAKASISLKIGDHIKNILAVMNQVKS